MLQCLLTLSAPVEQRFRLSPLHLAAGAAGLLLFAWTIRQTGVAPIAEGIRRVGAGFVIILALSGARFVVRALAWTLCAEDRGLRLRDTLPALIAGDAVGNVTPLGLFLSEPTKAVLVRHRAPLVAALSAVALENLFYSLTVALVIAGGSIALLFLFDVPATLRVASLVALVVLLLLFTAAAIILARNIAVVGRLVAWLDRRRLAPVSLASRTPHLEELERRIFGFSRRHPARLAPLLALESSFHVLGVAEVWVTLQLLVGAAAPTLLSTFVLEAVNRTIMVAFKFVPFRLGVDEAGTELMTRTLGLDFGTGVTMAIVRKVRMLVWSAVGVAILAGRGFRRPGSGNT